MFMHYCLILSAFFILNGFFKREIFVLNVNIQAYFFSPIESHFFVTIEFAFISSLNGGHSTQYTGAYDAFQ